MILVLVLMAAYLLYDRLLQGMDTQNLAVNETYEKGSMENKNEAEQEEQEPVPAPDFVVIDADGNEVALSDFIGKPVILNLWASWCGPCKMELPDFDDAYAQYGEDIQFLMVNLTDGNRETVEGAKAFIEEQGFSFPVYFDTELNAAVAYNASSIPATYFIDADGNIAGYARGAIGADTLQMGIDLILPQ